MRIFRRITCLSVTHQFIFRAQHILGHLNIIDSLSCFQTQRFRVFAPEDDLLPTQIPPFSDLTFMWATCCIPWFLQAQETTLLSITPRSLQMYWSSWNCFKISLCIQHSFPSLSVPIASSYIMSLKNRAIRFEFPASSFSTNSTQFQCPSSTLCNSQISLILKGLQLSESLSPPACLPIAINVLSWCLSSAPATPACFR